MEVGKEELQPESPSKGPSIPQLSSPKKVSPIKGLEMEEKAGEGKGPEPKSAGDERCQVLEPQDKSSSMDQSESESSSESSSDEDNDDCDWKRKRSQGAHWPHIAGRPSEVDLSGESSGENHPRGPGTLQSGCNEEANRNSCSQRHQRKTLSMDVGTPHFARDPGLQNPRTPTFTSTPRLRRSLVTTLHSLSRAIQAGVAEAKKQTCASISGDQLALLNQLREFLTGLVQTLYSMASQAAYVFPAEAWMMPLSPSFGQMHGAPPLSADSWAGAGADKSPTNAPHSSGPGTIRSAGREQK